MDLGRIIKPIEDEIAAKKAETEAAQAEKERREEELFRLHAADIQDKISNVVAPVLDEAMEQLRALGYKAMVRRALSQDSRIRNIVIEVLLETTAEKKPSSLGPPAYSITFLGDVENYCFGVMTKIGGDVECPQGANHLTLDEIDKQFVEAQVEAFVVRAIKDRAENPVTQGVI